MKTKVVQHVESEKVTFERRHENKVVQHVESE